MQRIVVFGASGSGKTSFGRWLGGQLALPFIDLDDVYWHPGWIESPMPEFRAAVDRITSGRQWVLTGNYSKARDLIWPHADTLIWLDLPLLRVLWRTTRRALRQARTGELICNGNRQTVAALVTGRDSLLGYTLRTYHSNRRTWPLALRLPEHAHAAVVRLRSPNQVAAWQASLQIGNTPVDR